MNIQEIKEKLPDVKIKTVDGRIITAKVYGRNLPFAKVSSPTWGNFGFDVSWETIERCINNDRPILL